MQRCHLLADETAWPNLQPLHATLAYPVEDRYRQAAALRRSRGFLPSLLLVYDRRDYLEVSVTLSQRVTLETKGRVRR